VPTWLYIAVPSVCFAGVIAAFFVGLCEAASDGDDALEQERAEHAAEVIHLPEPQLADVLHFDRERRHERRRSHARNGLA
jgi:hypothetical protein